MARVAIVTDSGADLTVAEASAAGIRVVPLTVSFGDESFVSGVDIDDAGFYTRLAAPGAPFPRTAAPSPGRFEAAFVAALADGADGVVCITLSSLLSATHSHARLAREAMPDAPIRLVDSHQAACAQGLLVRMAAEAAAAGLDADAVAARVEELKPRCRLLFVVSTLEYLKRGGRISAAQAAIGSVLSVKPIITLEDGVVETLERPRTAGKARARVLELLAAMPVERAHVGHGMVPEIEAFIDGVAAATGLERSAIGVSVVGPVIGAHAGPGAHGAAVIMKAG